MSNRLYEHLQQLANKANAYAELYNISAVEHRQVFINTYISAMTAIEYGIQNNNEELNSLHNDDDKKEFFMHEWNNKVAIAISLSHTSNDDIALRISKAINKNQLITNLEDTRIDVNNLKAMLEKNPIEFLIEKWKFTPINIDSKDSRYDDIHQTLLANADYAASQPQTQDRMLKEYILAKNQEYMQQIDNPLQELINNSLANSTNKNKAI